MQKGVMEKELLLLDIEAASYEEVLEEIYNRLKVLGYVKDTLLVYKG